MTLFQTSQFRGSTLLRTSFCVSQWILSEHILFCSSLGFSYVHQMTQFSKINFLSFQSASQHFRCDTLYTQFYICSVKRRLGNVFSRYCNLWYFCSEINKWYFQWRIGTFYKLSACQFTVSTFQDRYVPFSETEE